MQIFKNFSDVMAIKREINALEKLENSEKFEEALVKSQKIIDNYAQNQAIEIKKNVLKAKAMKGCYMISLSPSEETLAYHNNLIQELSNLPPEFETPQIQSLIMLAFLNKGVTLQYLKKLDEAIGVYDTAIRLFLQANNKYVNVNLAKAINNKSSILYNRFEYEEQLKNGNLLIDKFFSKNNSLALEVQVAEEVLMQIGSLAFTQQYDRAIELTKKAVEKYKNQNSKTFQPILERLKILGNIDYSPVLK